MNPRLGKKPARYDKRTIQLKSILKILPPIPDEWDVDSQFSFQLPTPMFANDQYGDCVIVGRAHLTLRFEGYEQKKPIKITDKDVIDQYLRESGGLDYGLVMLESLREWRNNGWRLGQRKIACLKYGGEFYDIYAYSILEQGNIEDVRACIYFLGGCYGGFQLPQSSMDQFNDGQIWDDVGDENIVGGHCVTMCSYNEIGPIGLTWGKKQQMTWAFYKKYADEAYGLVDNKNRFLDNSPLDVEKMEGYLQEITR